ncbi:hypothetical protein AB4Z17_04155 [Paenibacillus sp. TAF43_2]|uniref:hypothetical protein n=1 Tax=Paenibacillus sp. TAF43_2 TaxID=3233069 RepID=UPI003F9ADEF8
MFDEIHDKLEEMRKETDECYFCIDKSEYVDENIILTITIYRDESGVRVEKGKQWEIICETVLDQRLRLDKAFGYLDLLNKHPYLFKYNKPEYNIYGPKEAFKNDEIAGAIYHELQKYLQRFFALETISHYMPSYGTYGYQEKDRYASFCSGPIEIVNIYKKVFQAHSLNPGIDRSPINYNDKGKMKLLLMRQHEEPSFVVAKNFTYREVEC